MKGLSPEKILASVRFGADGLVPAAVQDEGSGEVLMLVQLNEEALLKCLETGRLHYLSPGKRKVWKKGETSGHYQEIVEIKIDCDDDALLVRVRPAGGACHLGYRTCFYRSADGRGWKVDREKVFDPEDTYPEYTYK